MRVLTIAALLGSVSSFVASQDAGHEQIALGDQPVTSDDNSYNEYAYQSDAARLLKVSVREIRVM